MVENWRLWEDSAWEYEIEEWNAEYGDPMADDDDDGIDESFNESKPTTQFKKGDKVKYNGKITTIMDVENDEHYGVDYLIANPNYDGKDRRYENIWVGDAVEPV
jgi:hypothetical protein